MLRQRATDIARCLPSSFEPAYFGEPDVEAGEVFPHIWFQDPCYASGIGHMELAQILLTYFDPSIPRLGLGYSASRQDMGERSRVIVRKLCGIAISNNTSPPNFINAFVAIVSCGEYFTDLQEQQAISRLMDYMQYEFAYYTARVASDLKSTWDRSSTSYEGLYP